MNTSMTLAELAVTTPRRPALSAPSTRFLLAARGRSTRSERQLDAGAIIAAIAHEDPLVPDQQRWDEAPIAALVEYIQSIPTRGCAQLPALIDGAPGRARHADKASCPRGLDVPPRRCTEAVLEHPEEGADPLPSDRRRWDPACWQTGPRDHRARAPRRGPPGGAAAHHRSHRAGRGVHDVARSISASSSSSRS